MFERSGELSTATEITTKQYNVLANFLFLKDFVRLYRVLHCMAWDGMSGLQVDEIDYLAKIEFKRDLLGSDSMDQVQYRVICYRALLVCKFNDELLSFRLFIFVDIIIEAFTAERL